MQLTRIGKNVRDTEITSRRAKRQRLEEEQEGGGVGEGRTDRQINPPKHPNPKGVQSDHGEREQDEKMCERLRERENTGYTSCDQLTANDMIALPSRPSSPPFIPRVFPFPPDKRRAMALRVACHKEASRR